MSCEARLLILRVTTLCLMTLLAGTVAASDRSFCAGVDDGTGTVELPPHGCAYLSPDEVFMITEGLPAGTTIELDPLLDTFFCTTTPCGLPGGTLGGEVESFDAMMKWQLEGTGDLAGFERIIHLPIAVQTHSGPRNPGDAVQTFPADLFQMQGGIVGDPDFDQLQLTAGTGFGLPSPGQTTLTRRHGGPFSVDSFFDI
ncbi:MAG: hypothetical protein GY906_20355, partial [bacterium]|nr:hypothetical protein [bacterium]